MLYGCDTISDQCHNEQLQLKSTNTPALDDFKIEALSLTPNISAESLSNLTTKGSFTNLGMS